LQAFDVCVRLADGTADANCLADPTQTGRWLLTSQATSVSPVRTAFGPTQGGHWSATNFVLPDVDRDAKTLGSPVEYLDTGLFQPLMIVRSPPVHFDAFDMHSLVTDPDDGSTSVVPGPDGRIDPTEVFDINNCFLTYLATGDSYVCDTSSAYGLTTETSSTLQGQINQSNSIGGSVSVSGGIGTGNKIGACAQDGRDKPGKSVTLNNQTVEVADGKLEPSFCAEVNAFVAFGGDEARTASQSRQVGVGFSYTSTVTTSAGNDAVYAAIQQHEVLEYPVYAGAGFGFGAGAPIEYVTTAVPLRTRFQWTSSQVYQTPLLARGLSPQNVLSYADSTDQLRVGTKFSALSAYARNDVGGIDVALATPAGIGCALDPSVDPLTNTEPLQVAGNDAYEDDVRTIGKMAHEDYPCAAGNVPVEIQDSGTILDRAYLVTEIMAPRAGFGIGAVLRLQPTTPIGATQTLPATLPGTTKFYRSPSAFPVDEWTVQRFNRVESAVQTDRESGYESSFGWSLERAFSAGLTASIAYNGGALLGFFGAGGAVAGEFSTVYNADGFNSLSVATTNSTRFAIRVSGDIRSNVSYTLRPFLTTSPTGAMVLDWTTGVDPLQTFWNNFYRDPGPDPGFALPNLLNPYKAPEPNSKPAITTPVLLQSPDFAGWNCRINPDPSEPSGDFLDQCRPRGAADPSASSEFALTAMVHNDSLVAYDRSTALKVRFYIGDPARGGDMIKEANVPSVRSTECINRFCLPSRGQSLVKIPWRDWFQQYPGLAGRGVPTDPLPIYVIVDPGNRLVNEVHDLTEPIEVRDCAEDYPTIANDWNSVCPTTNNEGYFLQRFDGPLAGSVDLSVTTPGDVAYANGQLSVTVRSQPLGGAAPNSGPVDVNVYRCPVANPDCFPQTDGVPLYALGTQQIAGLTPGGAVTLAPPVGTLTPGTVLWVQVVPRAAWEQPGGGPFDRTGDLTDNVVRYVVP